MDSGIDELLNDDEPENEAQPETIGQPRDEHGRFIPTGEPEPETVEDAPVIEPESVPPTPEVERDHVPVAALKSEREKRQWAEQRLAEMQARYAQVEEAPPSVFEDEAAWQQSLEASVSNQIYQERLFFSEKLATKEFGPELVNEAKQWGFERCSADAAFNQKVRASRDPIGDVVADFQKERTYAEMQKYGATDMAALEAKIEAKVEERLREKLKGELGIRTAPTTLAAERSVGSRNGPAWTGPAALDDLLQ